MLDCGDTAKLSHLDSMRRAASGVSVDEELVNLQKAQLRGPTTLATRLLRGALHEGAPG